MNRTAKWILIGGGGLLLLLIAAVVLIPLLVDVNRYKSQIEARVAAATGRNFEIGGNIDLSIFPWVGVALSDVRLGNPEGFDAPQMLEVDGFEARVKLLPLLSKQVEIDRVVLQGPRIVLVKKKDGQASWAFSPPKTGKEPAPAPAETETPSEPSADGAGFALQSLTADEIAIRNGTLAYIDRASDTSHELSDINLVLADVSLDQPVTLDFSTRINGRPVAVEGTFGPIGSPPASQPVAYDLKMSALEEIDAQLKGSARNLTAEPTFEMRLDVAAFSPRNVFERLGRPFPIQTTDPKVLDKVSFDARIQGGTQVNLEDGNLVLDDTKTTFTFTAKHFERPDIAFDAQVNAIDIDRYLPPPAQASKGKAPPAEGKAKKEGRAGEDAPSGAPDYAPLRKLVLDGQLKVGELKAANARMQNVRLQVSGRDGRFRIDPMATELYGGAATLTGTIDVQQQTPRSDLQLKLDNISAGPLVQDLARKNIIEGRLQSEVGLQFQGDDPDRIKRTLDGGGRLNFTDGAIVGIDLAAMVRNVQAAFGEGAATADRGEKTEFTEFIVPFTLRKGTFITEGTRLASPVMGVKADGQANLVAEKLDFRVEPEYVATLEGKRTSEEIEAIKVPILVSGSFQDPRFAPDLESIAKQQVRKEIVDSGKLDEVFEKNEDLKPLEETAKGLLKGILNQD